MDLKYLLHVSIPLWDHPQGAKNNVGLKLLRSTVYEVIWWHAVLFMLCPSGHSTHSGGGTQAEPDGHNINKTACHQITSYTVDLSNFSPTLFYAP